MAGDIVSGQEIGLWVAAKMGGVLQPNSQCIGLVRDGKIVAGVIYEGWNQRSIVCHIAIEGAVTREFMKAVSVYAFVTCGVHKVIGPIPSDNAKAIKNAARIGFTEEARIKDAAPNGDIILFTLTADQCRFLGAKNG